MRAHSSVVGVCEFVCFFSEKVDLIKLDKERVMNI